MPKSLSLPFSLLILIQVLDVSLHVATGQVEPVRITSNLVIALGASTALLGLRNGGALCALSGVIYLALNGFFLAQNGLTNPATEALRLPFFLFVAVSIVALLWLTRRASINQIDKE